MNNFFNTLTTFFKPPIFEGDEEKTRSAKLLHQITLANWFLPLAGVIVSFVNPSTRPFVMPAIILLSVMLIVVMLINQAGRVKLGSQIIVGFTLIILTYLNYSNGGEIRPLLLL